MAVAEDPFAAAQDASPIFTSRSIMVGDAARRVDDSYRSQDSAEDNRQSTRNVTFEVGNQQQQRPQRRVSYLNTSQESQSQANSAAQRARERSEEETLAHPVADAGLNAFGCVFIEVWVMAEDGMKLTRPKGGHWMDPAFAQSLPDESLIEKAWDLDREAGDCPPGAGLAGTLAEEAGLGARNVHWRQIKSLLDDPFVQRGSGKRMERFFELGIGLVAAVSFSFLEQNGIVLYYSRSTANTEKLRSRSNERYLIASADLIGANYCIRKARQESANMRKTLFREAVKKVKKELLRKGTSFASMCLDQDQLEKLKIEREREAAQSELHHDLHRVDKFAVKLLKKTYQFGRKAFKRLNNSRRKWRGARLHGPPRQSWSDVVYSFLGAFLTMLTILKISSSIGGGLYAFEGSWYSSTLCIVYALTPAPVGQPRQIMAAHLWNMLVGIACRQIPSGAVDFMAWKADSFGLPLVWKQSLAVGLGIAGQAKLGILHPPATGLSIAFASNSIFSWSTMLSVMLTDVVVIILSMMILNLEEKKQYPLYWLGFGWEGSGGTIGFVKSKSRSVRRSVRNRKNSILKKGDEAV